jgi:hypothetical protein
LTSSVFAPRSRPANWYSEDGRRVAAQHHRDGEGHAGVRRRVFAEIERAAAVGQPAHDRPVASDHLLAVDAQVLPGLGGPARDHQSPCDQRRDVARPAGLDRQSPEVEIRAFPDLLLAGRARHLAGRHVQHLPQHRQLVPGVLQALGRFGLLEVREQVADLAQGLDRVLAHAERDPCRGAEEVGEHRVRRRAAVLDGALEEQRRALGPQHPVGDLGHLEPGRHRGRDPAQLAARLELGDEVAQVCVTHWHWTGRPSIG